MKLNNITNRWAGNKRICGEKSTITIQDSRVDQPIFDTEVDATLLYVKKGKAPGRDHITLE